MAMNRDLVPNLKLISTESEVTAQVLSAFAHTPNARLKEIMAAAITHLHRFIQDTRPTEAEFETALRWITALGHHTHATHNETVLAADVLGASTLIDLINNDGLQGETMSALLGPFYRGSAPLCANGACIARSQTPGPALYFDGTVTTTDGRPLANAKIDVWQASPIGLYENQDAGQDDFNLRGIFHTDQHGCFDFVSVKPAGYPVPTDGPVGDLLRAQKRKPLRPAHIHFIVSAPGHRTLITQIFSDTPEALAADVVFGAKQQIVAELVEHTRPDAAHTDTTLPFYTCHYHFVLRPGDPTFPLPPISGKKST
jgi:catechol 1,2-dioxygenase